VSGAPPPDALARVPGAGPGGQNVHAVVRLAGGSVNDSWLVDTDDGRYVLRIQGPAWRSPGVDRRREQEAQRLAAAAGLAPAVIAQSPEGDVRVCLFIAGRVWSAVDYDQPAQLLRWCETLATLHRLPAPRGEPWQFAPQLLAGDYASRAIRHAAAPAQVRAVEAARTQAASAAAALAACALPPVLAHGDALAGNVVDDGRLWLIDWEFAQCADPVWDLAAVAVWTARPAAEWCALAEAAGWACERLAARLDAALTLHRALGSLWYLARGEAVPAVLASGAGSGQTSAPRVPDMI